MKAYTFLTRLTYFLIFKSLINKKIDNLIKSFKLNVKFNNIFLKNTCKNLIKINVNLFTKVIEM